MTYSINKTDGTILSTVPDGQVDTLSTNLTLIGKNYSGFGEALNENFIKLLENFADVSQPNHPIRGQIWFDSTELKLKVYNGINFVPVSSATIADSQPLNLGAGDLWFNDTNKQLYFFDGQDTILLGPAYSLAQGTSGLVVENLLDTLNQNRVVTYLYNNGILLGIFSKDAFTPKNPIEGFSGSIVPGFNAGSLEGLKFQVTVTNSEQLGGQTASTYVRNDTSNIINGQIIITSNLGLIVGDASQLQMFVTEGDIFFANVAREKNINFNVKKGIESESAIKIDSNNRQVNIYESFTDSKLFTGGDVEVTGNVTIRGNLTVNDGDVNVIKTSELAIEDKVIYLAETGDSAFNTDEFADGGGLILKGASEHRWIWTQSSGAWNSTEHINLETGKEFKIDGVTVLSGNALGPTITSIPGVTSFGAQTELTVDDLYLNDAIIQVTAANTDLTLDINGTGTLSLSGKRISNLSDPAVAQDAATKNYVDDTVRSRALAFTFDISDGISNTGIASYLELIAPVGEYEEGTTARVLCTSISNAPSTVDVNSNVSISQTEVNTPTGTAFVVGNLAVSDVTVPGQSISIVRVVKEFRIVTGAWTFIS
jgi:hypothetical protein